MKNHTETACHDWRRIQEIFDAAVAIDSDRREDFLGTACGADLVLRDRVDRLLAAHEGFSGTDDLPPDAAVLESAWSQLNAREGLHTDQRVGDFRIERLLGEGGMGAVYLAARDVDGQSQRVALKVASQIFRDARMVDRLRQERSILATLDHPGIARLVDAGELEDGRPYFAMEYVDGVQIVQYCDDDRLDLRSRLALFASVCEAVAYAHRRLVLHRDLKAGNILVDSTGRARLLDFGIAKALDDGGASSADSTMDGRFFSPHCAAPEQVSGGATSVSTDVYGLGCLLFGLLCGRMPFAAVSASREHLIQRILDEIPPLPSAVVVREPTDPALARRRGFDSLPLLRGALRGDLDAIVAKALRKRVDDRYSTVDEMLADVRAVIERRPIAARRHESLYRLQCFVRRHAWSVGVASTLAAVSLLTIGFALLQSVRVATERDRVVEALAVAEVQRDHARGVTQFLVDAFAAADPLKARGGDLRAEELLEAAAKTLSANRDQPPELRALIGQTLAHLYYRLEIADRAREQADIARGAVEQVYAPGTELQARQHLADAEAAFGEARYSNTIDAAKKGLTLLDSSNRAVDSDLYYWLMYVKSQGEIGCSDFHSSITTLFRAIVFMISKGNVRWEQVHNLGARMAGTFSDLDYNAASRDILLEILKVQQSQVPINEAAMVATHQHLSQTYVRLDQTESAEVHAAAALASVRKLYGDKHLATARLLSILANVYSSGSRQDEAAMLYRESIAIATSVGGGGNVSLGQLRYRLGLLYYKANDTVGAERELRAAWESFSPEQRFNRAYMDRVLAQTLIVAGRFLEAEYLLRRALPIVLELLGENIDVTYLRVDLAYVRMRQFDLEGARTLLSPAVLAEMRVNVAPEERLRQWAEAVAVAVGR